MAKGKQPEEPTAEHKLFCPAYGLRGGAALCECGAAQEAANQAEASRRAAIVGDGVVRVGRETQGRKGAGVTVITGIPLEGAELKALVKRLKKLCGGGGKIAEGRVEIQGDHRDKLVAELEKLGWQVRRSGG